MDSDGYPEEELLTRVREWPPTDCHGLLELLASEWWYPDYVRREGDVWFVSTGGWSGHEDLIDAMRQNRIWWACHAQGWRRGGHYLFTPISWRGGIDFEVTQPV